MLFWIRGKRAEDSEVVVIVRSRHLKVKIKELFNLERNGASTREKGSGHEASARHLTITKRSRSGRKSQDSDSTDMLPLHCPSQATLTCHLVFSVGAFVIPFFPSRIDVPQMVQGVIGPSLSSSLSIRHPSRARATSCVILVSCLGGGVRFVKT